MDTTSASLLIRLQSAHRDTVAWNRFVDLYTPLIYYWARKIGLQSSDASDLVQEVLTTLVRKLPEFQLDPEKSFRGWLRTVTFNKYRQLQRRKSVNIIEASESFIGNLPDRAIETWDADYARQLVSRAMQLAQPLFEVPTWKALNEYVRQESSAVVVAEKYGISIWTVYSAKSRLLAHLREQLEGLLDE